MSRCMHKDAQLRVRLEVKAAVSLDTGLRLRSANAMSFLVVWMFRFLAEATYNVSGSVKVLGLVSSDKCHLCTFHVLFSDETERNEVTVEPQRCLNTSPHHG